MADLTFSLLWWTILVILLHADLTMWKAILISFFAGWILPRILEKIGYAAIGYKITPGQPAIYLPTDFFMPWWKQLLAILLPSRKETLRAEIRYLYEEGDNWPNEAIWKESNSHLIFIGESGRKHITVLDFTQDMVKTIEAKPLPSRFILDVQIKRASDNKPRAYSQLPLIID